MHLVPLLLAVLALTGWDQHCSAFVAPAQTLRSSAPKCVPTTSSPTSELQLFKTLDRVRGKFKEDVLSNNHGVNIHTNGEASPNMIGSETMSGDKIPFVIERLGSRPRDQVFRDIAEMCIA